MTSVDKTREHFVDLTSAIGECIASWNGVEDEISNLFVLLHGRPCWDYTDTLRAAYEAVTSLDVKLQMIAATAKADPITAPIYADHCLALCEKTRKLYKKRHQIAHFGLVWRDSGKGPEIKARPFFKHSEFLENVGPAELSIGDIRKKQEAFNALRLRVQAHLQYVGEIKALSPGYFIRMGQVVHDNRALATRRVPSKEG